MLQVEGLERRVGRFRLAVDKWTVERGQYLVLVGPSGAGKTMLLETVAGLNQPQRGRIRLDGVDVTRQVPEKRGVGLVYQDCWLFPHLTVRANIDFGRRYHRFAEEEPTLRTDALAEMLNISHLLDRKSPTLSGGERQRVALARALAIRPRLLFLDEPLGNLDPANREHVGSELMSCHRRFGMTTVHVTHDHTEARMLGDAAAVVLGGQLVQSGPTDEVFGRPQTAELARFLGCENVHRAQAVPGPGDNGSVTVHMGQDALEAKSDLTGEVMACVPPEHVQLGPGEENRRASGLTGRIDQVSLRGALARVVVRVSERNWVSLVSRTELRENRFAVGDEVSVRIPPDVCHLIPAEEPS